MLLDHNKSPHWYCCANCFVKLLWWHNWSKMFHIKNHDKQSSITGDCAHLIISLSLSFQHVGLLRATASHIFVLTLRVVFFDFEGEYKKLSFRSSKLFCEKFAQQYKGTEFLSYIFCEIILLLWVCWLNYKQPISSSACYYCWNYHHYIFFLISGLH